MRAALGLLLLLAACGPVNAPAPAGPPVPDAAEDTCGASTLGRLIGRDATALERELILRPMRLIRPGTPVTEDFRPTRINFQIDGQERLTRIWCG